jgi:hypothetical protein
LQRARSQQATGNKKDYCDDRKADESFFHK